MFQDFLAREQVLDKETAKALKAKWFEILLSSKLPEMKDNLRVSDSVEIYIAKSLRYFSGLQNVLDYMEKLVEIDINQKRVFEEGRVEASKQLNTQVQSHSRALDNLYGKFHLYNIIIGQTRKDIFVPWIYKLEFALF